MAGNHKAELNPIISEIEILLQDIKNIQTNSKYNSQYIIELTHIQKRLLLMQVALGDIVAYNIVLQELSKPAYIVKPVTGVEIPGVDLKKFEVEITCLEPIENPSPDATNP